MDEVKLYNLYYWKDDKKYKLQVERKTKHRSYGFILTCDSIEQVKEYEKMYNTKAIKEV